MSNKNFSDAKIHEIVGRVKLDDELIQELLKYDVKSFHSAKVDFSIGELILEAFTIIYED